MLDGLNKFGLPVKYAVLCSGGGVAAVFLANMFGFNRGAEYAMCGGALSGRAGTEPLLLRSPGSFGLRQVSKPTWNYPGTRTRQRSDEAPGTQNHTPSPGEPLPYGKTQAYSEVMSIKERGTIKYSRQVAFDL